MEYRRTHRFLMASAALTAVTLLTACTSEREADGTTPTTSATTTVDTSVAETTMATSSTETSTRTSATATSTTTSSTLTSTTTEESDGVEEVAERFGTLAPDSLFEQFESCNPTGLEGTYECSGPQVGQFQFFDSHSKAASTTQLLTELRSSRVVEDTGRKIVGWSTLGTTAVITVVDNDLGLVAQQLVSSDTEDPQKRIYELGLSEPPADQASESEEPEE